jgi:regulator of sigma E protease
MSGTGMVGQIGAAFEAETIELPLWSAIRYGAWTTYKLAADMVDTITGLVRGKVSPSNLVGPIGIAQISGQAAAQGVLTFIAILAFLSLNLGLFNLLPIPVLDGGALALLCIEALAGRDLKPKVKENITKLGFAKIVGIMAMVTFNDLVRTLGHLISKP